MTNPLLRLRTGTGALLIVVVLVGLWVLTDLARDRVLESDWNSYGAEELWWIQDITDDAVSVRPALMYAGARGVAESRKHGECIDEGRDCMPNGYYLRPVDAVSYARAAFDGATVMVMRNPVTGFVDNATVVEPEWEEMTFDAFVQMRTRCKEEEARTIADAVFTGGDYVWYLPYEYCGGDWFNPTLDGDRIVSLKYRYLP